MTTKQSMFMRVVAALSLGWATTAIGVTATGQTTCYNSAGAIISCTNTGQDGEVLSGAALAYTDNGDGTISDVNTGLMWAKKSDDGGIHDRDNVFTWQQALDYANNLSLAGHSDWRLPNVKELGTIVNYEVFFPGPTVSPAFNTNCAAGATVVTGSCTASSGVGTCAVAKKLEPFTYWTSTSGDIPTDAWFVDFITGDLGAHSKIVACDKHQGAVMFAGHARAVRGVAQ